LDSHGNRILWGWIPEKRPEAEFSAAGWAGCMALPRLLSIGAENDLEMRVAPIENSLRAKAFVLPQQHAGLSERTATLKAIHFDNVCGELAWENKGATSTIALGTAQEPGGRFMSSPRLCSQADRQRRFCGFARLFRSRAGISSFLDASVAELICRSPTRFKPHESIANRTAPSAQCSAIPT